MIGWNFNCKTSLWECVLWFIPVWGEQCLFASYQRAIIWKEQKGTIFEYCLFSHSVNIILYYFWISSFVIMDLRTLWFKYSYFSLKKKNPETNEHLMEHTLLFDYGNANGVCRYCGAIPLKQLSVLVFWPAVWAPCCDADITEHCVHTYVPSLGTEEMLSLCRQSAN